MSIAKKAQPQFVHTILAGFKCLPFLGSEERFTELFVTGDRHEHGNSRSVLGECPKIVDHQEDTSVLGDCCELAACEQLLQALIELLLHLRGVVWQRILQHGVEPIKSGPNSV